jgi:hypothetical protein
MESSTYQGNYYYRNITTAEELNKNLRFGILSHGIQADPIYNYGNAASLSLFEQTIENLCQTPSRYSTVRAKINHSNTTYHTNHYFFYSISLHILSVHLSLLLSRSLLFHCCGTYLGTRADG